MWLKIYFKKCKLLRLISFALLLISATQANRCLGEDSAPTKKSVVKRRIRLQGSAVQNELVDRLERLGIKLVVRQGEKSTVNIGEVKLGTAAYSKGLISGDTLLSMEDEGGFVTIAISRNGKMRWTRKTGPLAKIVFCL